LTSLLTTLQADQGLLEATVYTGARDRIGTSEPSGAGTAEAAFLCPAGWSCGVELAQQAGGGWTGGAIPFSLDVHPATLQPEDTLILPVRARDLALHDGSLVLAGPLGVGLLDPATLCWVGFAMGPGLTASRAVTPCGPYLCLARLGLRGLKVLDVSDPASPQVKGSASPHGLGWDVAADGRKVFVAQGILGVGVYDLDGQGQPSLRQTLSPGGIVRSVAARKGVLAAARKGVLAAARKGVLGASRKGVLGAARKGGAVTLYRLGDAIQPAATIHGLGKIDRVRFVGGRLFVLSKKDDQVAIYSVADPDAPVLLGTFTDAAAEIVRSQWLGARMLTLGSGGHALQVSRAQAQP
jgi:hypothetical protein